MTDTMREEKNYKEGREAKKKENSYRGKETPVKGERMLRKRRIIVL